MVTTTKTLQLGSWIRRADALVAAPVGLAGGLGARGLVTTAAASFLGLEYRLVPVGPVVGGELRPQGEPSDQPKRFRHIGFDNTTSQGSASWGPPV